MTHSAVYRSVTHKPPEIYSIKILQNQPVLPYPHILPPVRQDSDPIISQLPPPQETTVINTIQEQLHQTQSLLSTHVEKIHNLGLENIVGEHDGIKREIGMLRDLIDQQKHEIEISGNTQHRKRAEEDDDDARSVATVVPTEQYQDEELEEENEEERRRRRDELGRPRTPEPSMGMDGDSDGEGDIGVRGMGMHGPSGTIRRSWDGSMNHSDSGSTEAAAPAASRESVERLTDRLEQLAAQFESALELSRDLQAKQVAAQEQIATLQAKVDELESIKETVSNQPASEPVAAASETTPAISNLIDLTKNLEGCWERHQEAWQEERDRLRAAKEEWERRVRRVEDDLLGVREIASAATSVAANASSSVAMTAKALATLSAELRDNDLVDAAEGDHEFAAPPSPRSISSDVLRKRKRSSARAQSRSTSQSPPPAIPNGHIIGNDDIVHPYSPTSLNSAPYTNGPSLESNGFGNDGRRLPSGMKGLDSVSRTDSMSSSSISSASGRKPDIVSATFLPLAFSPVSPPTQTSVGTTGNSEASPRQCGTQDVQLPAEVVTPSVRSPALTSLHSHYGHRFHWLIIFFIFSFLLPQPIPYMSAAATLGVALLGVAAWTAANHIHA